MSSEEICQVESNALKLEELDRLWRPFMKLARAVGVFPFVPEHLEARPWWRNLWNFCSMFSVCAFCGQLGLVVASRVAYGGPITIVDVDFLTIVVLPLHLIASTSGFVYFLNSTSFLDDMRRLWSSITFSQEMNAWVNSHVKRKMRCGLVLCAFALLQVVYGHAIYRVCHSAFPVTDILDDLPLAWCITVHVIQTGLFCTMCCAISCLLKGFCQDMETKLAKSSNLKSFKDNYTAVIDLIQVSNQLFGNYVGLLVYSSLLQACFDTYTLIVHTSIHKNVFHIVLLIVYNLLTTVIVCLSAVGISDQARRPYRILMKMDLSRCCTSQQNEILVLLDCFRNSESDISMFRIMPITTQTLPTIIGLYFSYMFLLFQFPTGKTDTSKSQAAKPWS